MDGDHDADDWEDRDRAAYAAFNRGDLSGSVTLFEALAAQFPDAAHFQYMLGLAHKYRRDWAASLHHNLLSLRPDGDDKDQQGNHWNAAIAATALGNWQQAREQWRLCGLKVESGVDPIDEDWGNVCVRLNAWESGETLFAQRRSPATALLASVPLASSGFRYGDLVLVDGARTGERKSGGRTVPVLNAFQRIRQSEFKTYVATVFCTDRIAANALEEATGPGIGLVEDWTGSVKAICRRCSYGIPHEHDAAPSDPDDWLRERQFGIAATSRAAVDTLLAAWCASEVQGLIGKLLPSLRKHSRQILDLDDSDHEIPEMTEGQVWWREPEPEAPASESPQDA
ncbi:hypothetical protein BH11PSE14_BH11PSE14_03950 [soil metagenome]